MSVITKTKALQLLQEALQDNTSNFREGQWEAIDALVNKSQKNLVVQRTGWGKSIVYFLSAKIYRDQNLGPTIIISPLISLMRNQIDFAQRMEVVADKICSENQTQWSSIEQKFLENKIDCLLISPERLANDHFIQRVLRPIAGSIALMVIDEAHCISDWGHDFRPDYQRIVNIINRLPSNTPILCTTATANNRVINDIKDQLGNISIQRGSLVRESIGLQTISMPDPASRLAWLAKTIPNLEGTGIIYVLTQRDAEQVTDWLVRNNIQAKAYHASITNNTGRDQLEKMLFHNDLKVLVATSALGMGYDKPDLSFVIHYQTPNSLISYYQQVGRAGRKLKSAIGILMSGNEDDHIRQYFQNSAFPSKSTIECILKNLENSDGLSSNEIQSSINLSKTKIEQALKYLNVKNPSPILKDGSKWKRTPIDYKVNQSQIDHINAQRNQEWDEVQSYLETRSCKMSFICKALDDPNTVDCGQCESCLQKPIVDPAIDAQLVHNANIFLKCSEEKIVPRKQVPSNSTPIYNLRFRLPEPLQAQTGRVLSRWGGTGWGKMVERNKQEGQFSAELVDAIVEMIKNRWKPNPRPLWVCCVPSHNKPELVLNFAISLAEQLNVPFVDAVSKVRQNAPQKEQQNLFHQFNNLDGVFSIKNDLVRNEPVLLVDDVVDSGCTFTILAALLQQAGSGAVFPVALASSSKE